MPEMKLHWIVMLSLTAVRTAESQDPCPNTVVTYPGYNVPGGYLDPDATTISSCLQSCLNYDQCTGFDLDGASQCWIIFGGTITQSTGNSVTHYEVLRNVYSCTADCSGTQSWSWVVSANKHTTGGSAVPTANTITKCLLACRDSSSCTGIDWDPSNGCWLSVTTTTNSAPGITHYDKFCSKQGAKIVTPGLIPPNQSKSTPYSVVQQRPVAAQVQLQDQVQTTTQGWKQPEPSTKPTTVGFPVAKPTTLGYGVSPSKAATTQGFMTSKTPGFTSSGAFQSSTKSNQPTDFTASQKVPVAADDTLALHVSGQAIKPAYIVLIGLGAGCILLVILAVCTLCLYPLKGKEGDRFEAKKKTKKQKGELHTRRPKTLSEEEHVGMSTVTTANRNSYEHNSYNNNNHRVSSGSVEHFEKQADDYTYNKAKDTLEYNHHDSGSYNKRDSIGSIRKSGGYEEPDPYGHNDKETILDKAHDRAGSFVDDVKDNASYLHEEYD